MTIKRRTSFVLTGSPIEAVTLLVRHGDTFMAMTKPGHEPETHPLVGDELNLQFGVDANAARLAVRCTLRARVYLLASGLVRVTGPFLTTAPIHAPDADGQLNLLRSAENGTTDAIAHQRKLAIACGFADWDALWAAQKKLRLDRQGRAVREVVGWKLV